MQAYLNRPEEGTYSPGTAAAAEALTLGRSEFYLGGGRLPTNSIFSEALSILIEGVHDSDRSIRSIAITTLGEIDEPTDIIVLTLIEATKDSTVRSLAIDALGNIGSTAELGTPALIEALEDPDASVRKHAVVTLGKINEPADVVVPALIKALEDPDASVRDSAVTRLGVIGEPADMIVPALIKALEDPVLGVRDNAVITLGVIGKPGSDAVVALVEALRWPHNRSMRIYAAEALGKICDPVCIPALMEAQNDQFEVIRLAASSALKHLAYQILGYLKR